MNRFSNRVLAVVAAAMLTLSAANAADTFFHFDCHEQVINDDVSDDNLSVNLFIEEGKIEITQTDNGEPFYVANILDCVLYSKERWVKLNTDSESFNQVVFSHEGVVNLVDRGVSPDMTSSAAGEQTMVIELDCLPDGNAAGRLTEEAFDALYATMAKQTFIKRTVDDGTY